MKRVKRLPAKVWILIACAAVLAFSPVSTWLGGLIDTKDQRGTFLDAVADDMAKDPRLSVVRVNHESGQIVVFVKPTNQRLTLTVTRAETKTPADGQEVEVWTFDWKDEAGTVVSLGHARGSRSKSIHVSVPGLP
jgi:hypothetical protein